MPAHLLQELAYFPDSARYFAELAQQPWAMFLDSCSPFGGGGRYDILVADPFTTLVTRGEVTEITRRGEREISAEDPLELLRRELDPHVQQIHGLPFSGGALGYFSYDLARRIERLPVIARDETGLPEMAVGLYDHALVVDHQKHRCWLAGRGVDASAGRTGIGCASPPRGEVGACEVTDFRVTGRVESNLVRTAYGEAFRRVQHYIHEGDCYQVNLAQRFSVPVEGDPWALYQALRRTNPAPYSAFLRLPWATVLSSSPECFLKVSDAKVQTRPIKGTRPRGATPEEDRAQIDALQSSTKDRAENLMIVDLLRNDLGKSCLPGSVRVPELFKAESFARVHHLVSTVTGRLASGQDALSLLRGCFPGGSITGAPKIRAMEIIEELEPCRRSVYCGALGYLGFDGNMDTSIAIRTLLHCDGVLRFWAGGGIVADSRLDAEYQETLDKVAAILDLLERLTRF